MKEAPKDRLIIAVFNNNPPILAHWSESIKKWASASLQCEHFHGEWNGYYFENEWFEPEELKQWMEIPEVENKKIS